MSKTFNITIECENASFEEDWRAEVSRILTKLIGQLYNGHDSHILFDVNGNSVGSAYWRGCGEDDVFDTPEEYTISSHWLSYLINGDNSSYTDEEDEMIQKWEKDTMNGRVGHFSYPDDDSGNNFALCEFCGLLADCTTVTFWPNKKHD